MRDEEADYLRRSVQARERQVELLEGTARTVRQSDLLSLAYSNLGSIYAKDLNDLEKSETNYRRALSVAEALVAEAPDYRLAWTRLVSANNGLASMRYRRGDYQGELDHYLACLRAIREANVRVLDVQMQTAEPTYMLRVAGSLFRTGKAAEALQFLREALAVHNRLTNFNRTSTQSLMTQAAFLRWTGDVYAGGGRATEALATYREAEMHWRQAARLDPKLDVAMKVQVATICILRGEVYAANRAQRREARTQFEKAIDALSQLQANNQIPLDQIKELIRAKDRLRALAG